MVRKRPIDISRFKHLYPFSSHYMDIRGQAYHYLDEGFGDPIIMIHGNPTWSFYYRTLITALSPGYRTLAPDHLGCGLSDKPSATIYGYHLKNRVDDFDCFIENLYINKKLTLLVHDWGGMIGMAYALRHPEKIGRLIILNTTAFLPPGNKRLPLRLGLIRHMNIIGKLGVLGLNLFARCALFMATEKKLSRDVQRGLIAPYNRPRHRLAVLKFVEDIPTRSTDPSFDLVKKVDDNLNRLKGIPMLMLWGMKDFVFDADYLNEWRRRFPEAEAHKFPQAGHYVLEDVPELIIPLVNNFLKRYPV